MVLPQTMYMHLTMQCLNASTPIEFVINLFKPIFHLHCPLSKTPSAIVTPSRNKVFLDKLKIARKSGIACEDLEASQFEERYPMLEFPGCSVFTYSILIIDAHKAVQCLQV